MVPDSVDIQTTGVVDGGVVLNDTDDPSSVLLKELGSPVANSSESLNDDGLTGDTFTVNKRIVYETVQVKQLLDAVVDAETSGLGTTLDTTLRGELTSSTTLSINVGLTMHIHVSVLDPGHDLFVGAEIGTEAIDLGSNESFLCELHSVLPGDLL